MDLLVKNSTAQYYCSCHLPEYCRPIIVLRSLVAMCVCANFQAIEEPFIVAVRDVLSDRFSSSLETLYRKTIKFILQTLTTGFENSAVI